jgi:hypothetical protein
MKKEGGVLMRTPYETARSIAKKVILAQDASDAGKRKTILSMNSSTRYSSRGYTAKNTYILAALKEISTTKPCGWNFYVVPDQKDQNGHSSVITYFQYKSAGVRYEISFHTPANQGEFLKPFFNKGRKTHWNGDIGGSRQDSQTLIDLFNL